MNKISAQKGKWVFSVDQGGTFTDIIGADSSGRIFHGKCLSQSSGYANPIHHGISKILEKAGMKISPEIIGEIKIGTTICTNALLERKGSRVGLMVTEGFEDILEIGDQARPDIFDVRIKKSEPLFNSAAGVRERINASGEIEIPLLAKDVERTAKRLEKDQVDSIAVLFLHAWKNKSHEMFAKKILMKRGFKNVICSSEVMPLIKMVTRGQTTLVDAYLSLVLSQYITAIQKDFKGIPFSFMMSSGGLSDLNKIRAKDSILSGPSGGAIAAAKICDQLHISEGIGFDMGGTSTDVCRYDGELHRKSETELAGIRYQTDQLDIETVAAGGGSVLGFDGLKITVGPESAGAMPGPACYGNGGPLTVTDANLILGRILPKAIQKSFGPSGKEPLNKELAMSAFKKLTARINAKLKTSFTEFELAIGYIRVADENMARAIRKISVAQGYDIRNFTLICFGGAAAQHACGVANILGIKKIIIHPLSGVLSAFGIHCSDQTTRTMRAYMKPIDEFIIDDLLKSFDLMEKDAWEADGIEKIMIKRTLDVRPVGSDTYLSLQFIEGDSVKEIQENFNSGYKERFGFIPKNSDIEIVNIRSELSLSAKTDITNYTIFSEPVSEKSHPAQQVYFNNKHQQSRIYYRHEIGPDDIIQSPAIILEPHTTLVIEPGFEAKVNLYDQIELTAKGKTAQIIKRNRDPVSLEVFNHRFMGIAEQMGYTLANAAHSVNMKERLDFSCAIFDDKGDLVANAPHIPVHLGAMGDSVKSILAEGEDMKKGDVFLINNPHNGGSHLPDITAVSPVFINNELVFFVATRGHHADIGGAVPGSMPANAKTLEEEGVVIDKFLLVRDGKFHEKEITDLLTGGRYPARNIPERISDLRAQCAANARGMQALEELADEMSIDVVKSYMQHIQDNAAEAMEDALHKILDGKSETAMSFQDNLDDGSALCVEVRITKNPSGCKAEIDFTGTGTELEGNLNAPVSVVKSAVLYVLRILINRNIPLNAGCFRPVELIIPKESFLNPSHIAAVAGGNVETSQRIVDVLLGAIGVAAASQGTMNNFTFGDPGGKGMQYYETIAGGSGAAEGHEGASAVQTHMTNTRITDPEVIEHRFPNLRVDRFAIRKGSGGEGKWNGGDGSVRAVRFMEQTKVSLLTERRKYQPYGMEGGNPGKTGQNILVDSNGNETQLDGKEEILVEEGESIIIKTPGGGGYGKP